MRKITTIITLSLLIFGYACKTKKKEFTNNKSKNQKISDSGVSFYYTFSGDKPYRFTMLMDRTKDKVNTYWFSEKNNNYNGVMVFDKSALNTSKRQVMAPFNRERARNDRLFRVISQSSFSSFANKKYAFIRIADKYEGHFKIIGKEEYSVNVFGNNKIYNVCIAECKEINMQLKFINDQEFPLIVSLKSGKEMRLVEISRPALKNVDFIEMLGENMGSGKMEVLSKYIINRSYTYQKTPSIAVTKSSLGGIHFNTKNGKITDIFLLDNGVKYNCRNRKFPFKTSEGLYIGMPKTELDSYAGKGESLEDGGSLYYSKIAAEISFKKEITAAGQTSLTVSEIHFFKI